MKNPLQYIPGRFVLDIWVLPAVGLSLLPLIRFPRLLILSGLLLAFIIPFQVKSIELLDSTFPLNGNIVDHTGFVMQFYDAAPIWTEWFWLLLGILGALVIALYLVVYAEQIVHWLRTKPWQQRGMEPALLLYFLTFLLVAAVHMAAYLVDRYLLPVLPLLIVAELQRLSKTGTAGRSSWRWAIIVPLALFAVIGQRDYMAHATTRWQAAEQIASQGVRPEQIDAGMEWAGWYSYKAGEQYIRDKQDFTYLQFPPDAVLDPAFAVSDSPRPGYIEIGSMSYESWLNGGQPRRVLLLKRK